MIFKIHQTESYTVMSNAHLRDTRLSLKAKGLMSVMLSLPPKWDYSIAGLVAISAEGQTAVESALKELKDCGYLVVEKLTPDKTATGRYEYEYNIYETPLKGSQTPVKDTFDYSEVNLPPTTKKSELTRLIDNYATDNEMRELLNQWLMARKSKRATATIYAIELNLKNLHFYAKESGMDDKTYLREVVKRGWAAFYPIRNYNKEQKTETKPHNASYDIDKFKQDSLNDDLIYTKKGQSDSKKDK